MMPVLLRREIAVSGIRLSYLEREADAPSAKPAVVLLHGLIAEAEVFRKLIAELPSELATARRIIAIDLPGAGYSERPVAQDVSFRGLAAIIHEVISALGLYKPILLGHSHGGAVALQVTADYPDTSGALVLMCPAHPFSKHEDKLVRFYLSGIGRRFAAVLPRLPRWLHLFAFRRMPGSRKAMGYAEIEPYLHTLRTPGTVPHMLRLLESWQADMKALGATLTERPIEAPVYLLWGDRDIVVPIATARDLLPCFEKWEMTTLRGVGHLPNEEAPVEGGKLIGAWFRSLEDLPKYQAYRESLLTHPGKIEGEGNASGTVDNHAL